MANATLDVNLQVQFHWVPAGNSRLLYSMKDKEYIARVDKNSCRLFDKKLPCRSVDEGQKMIEKFLLSTGAIEHALYRVP
jgi:hypothetical protein